MGHKLTSSEKGHRDVGEEQWQSLSSDPGHWRHCSVHAFEAYSIATGKPWAEQINIGISGASLMQPYGT